MPAERSSPPAVDGTENMADERCLRALRFDALTPLYDFVIRHPLPDAEFGTHNDDPE
jgi:hypothetical protein